MVFHWSDSESSQASWTLLSILNNAVVWIVFTRLLITKSSSPCTIPLVTVLTAPITNGITDTFMFNSFFNSLARSWYFSFFLHFLSTLLSGQPGHNPATSLFLSIIIRSGRLAEIRWSVRISKSQRSLCISLSKTDSGLCRVFHTSVSW